MVECSNTSSRFSFYVTFKSSLLPEQYFDCVALKCYPDALIKIRLGVLPINSNKYRYSEDDRKKLCDFSQSQVEDEFRFVCMCPQYNRFRTKYLDPDMHKKNNSWTACQHTLTRQILMFFLLRTLP